MSLRNVAIDAGYKEPQLFQRARKIEPVELLVELLNSIFGLLLQRRLLLHESRIQRRGATRIRHLSIEVSVDHRQRAARQIAQPIRQVAVIALYQRVEAERPVLSEDDFAQQEVAQRILAQRVENSFAADNIAARLRHLAFFEQ